MTRAELAKIAVRAAGADKSLDEKKRELISKTIFYVDVEDGEETPRMVPKDDNANGKKWMFMATNAGILQGVDQSGTLGETLPTSRSQAIVVLNRILKYMKGEPLEISRYAVTKADLAWRHTNIFSMWPEFFNQGTTRFMIDGSMMLIKPEDIWVPEQLFLSFEKKGYPSKGYLDELILVDWNDPNDPYRHLVDAATEEPREIMMNVNILSKNHWWNGEVDKFIEEHEGKGVRFFGNGTKKVPYDPNVKAYVLIQKAHFDVEDPALQLPQFRMLGLDNPFGKIIVPYIYTGVSKDGSPYLATGDYTNNGEFIPKDIQALQLKNNNSNISFSITASAHNYSVSKNVGWSYLKLNNKTN